MFVIFSPQKYDFEWNKLMYVWLSVDTKSRIMLLTVDGIITSKFPCVAVALVCLRVPSTGQGDGHPDWFYKRKLTNLRSPHCGGTRNMSTAIHHHMSSGILYKPAHLLALNNAHSRNREGILNTCFVNHVFLGNKEHINCTEPMPIVHL